MQGTTEEGKEISIPEYPEFSMPLFTPREIIDILTAANERGVSAKLLIRRAVLDDLVK